MQPEKKKIFNSCFCLIGDYDDVNGGNFLRRHQSPHGRHKHYQCTRDNCNHTIAVLITIITVRWCSNSRLIGSHNEKSFNMKNRAYDWLVLFISVIQLDKRNIVFLRIFFVHLHHFTTSGMSVWLCIADDRTELSSRAWWTMTNVQWLTFHFYLVCNINPDGYDNDDYRESNRKKTIHICTRRVLIIYKELRNTRVIHQKDKYVFFSPFPQSYLGLLRFAFLRHTFFFFVRWNVQ